MMWRHRARRSIGQPGRLSYPIPDAFVDGEAFADGVHYLAAEEFEVGVRPGRGRLAIRASLPRNLPLFAMMR
jgi:hypothetical protein